jgi:hypothetical protein
MYISFDELNESSRLWIYQSNRPLVEKEIAFIEKSLHAFCEQWAAHGHALKTSFKIAHHQFIILAADEDHHLPSGCSIDSSVHIIKSLQQHTGTDFFDRSQIAFWINEEVKLISMNNLKDEFSTGTLTADTLTFNNLVAIKADWQKSWKTAAKNTWLNRYLPKDVVVS